MLNIVAAKSYLSQKKFKSLNTIFPSLYGPHDKFDEMNSHNFISDSKIFEAKKKIKSLLNAGDGKPIREFLFIEDATGALVRNCKSYNSVEPQCWNR